MGEANVVEPMGTMCAEDMSFFLEKVDGALKLKPLRRVAHPSCICAGCFFFVGSAPRPDVEEVPHHKSNFDIDERALLVGGSIWVQLIEDLLG